MNPTDYEDAVTGGVLGEEVSPGRAWGSQTGRRSMSCREARPPPLLSSGRRRRRRVVAVCRSCERGAVRGRRTRPGSARREALASRRGGGMGLEALTRFPECVRR